jgi:hypothetical protein
MNQAQLMSASITGEYGVSASLPRESGPVASRIGERIAELRSAIGGLTAAAPRKAIAELPSGLSIEKFVIQGTAMKSSASGFASQQVHLGTDKPRKASPLWVKVGSVTVLLLLAAGVVTTVFDRNAFTMVLVPLGFTLWAALVCIIRFRDPST